MKKYFLRKETFGYTFYDKSALRHKFLKKSEVKEFLRNRGVNEGDCDFLSLDRLARNDILYSPIRIYYELTLACDLRCKFCFNNSGKPRPNELTTDEVIKSLETLKKANVMDVRFTGGEPTQRKDWFEILKVAKNLGFAVSCNTNANYLNDNIPKQLSKLNLEQVTVSIDGTEAHHEQNRGKNTFKRAVGNIKLMHRLGVKLRFNTLVSKYNIDDVEFMVKLASKYATEINFFVVRFIGRGSHLGETHSVDMEKFKKMSLRAGELKKKFPQLNILYFAKVTHNTSINEDINKKLGLKIGLPGGLTTLNITSDGGLWSNGYIPYIDPLLCLGNIKTNDLVDVWQKSPLLEMIRNTERDLKRYCDNCPLSKEKCIGASFENELNRLINPQSPNPYCEFGDEIPLLLKI